MYNSLFSCSLIILAHLYMQEFHLFLILANDLEKGTIYGDILLFFSFFYYVQNLLQNLPNNNYYKNKDITTPKDYSEKKKNTEKI